MSGVDPLLDVRGLCVECDDPLGKIIPVADLSFALAPGDIVGLVGGIIVMVQVGNHG